MKANFLSWLIVAGLVFAAGCNNKQKQAEEAEAPPKPEPNYVTVQHILIGFSGSVPGKAITRTSQEAKKLAEELLTRAREGEDFDALVKEYTDDSHPGIYKMANFKVPADMTNNVFPRDGMVQAFGDIGFPLEVGEIGLAMYDPEKSKYGYHVIKRIE